METIAGILDAAQEGSRKTHILYRVNLSFMQLESYLGFLLEGGLIEGVEAKVGRGVLYRTTERGRRFRETLRELESF